MDAVEVLGFVGAFLTGITLGFIGGGGSILTVPILVYLLGVPPVVATSYSLFVVGFSALIGGVRYARKGLVSFKVGLVFTIPAFFAVYLTRLLLVPNLPELIVDLSYFTLTKDAAILLLFAILMVFASFSMIRNRSSASGSRQQLAPALNYAMLILEGVIVGVLTGIVGAGGGFLIIPALVVFARLPMKMAVGTSLLIIAAKSLIGFAGDVQAGGDIDWLFLGIFSALAGIGIFIGMHFSSRADERKLKKGFGWFVLVMGSFMVLKELFG